MTSQRKLSSNTFYLISLQSSVKNTDLLDSSGVLKPDTRRNVDYTILSEEAWLQCKKQYNYEIQVKDVYEVFISFSCNGVSYKNLYVHGVEKVFDVIQTLFVNKTFGLDYFKEMFEVKSNQKIVDPSVNFEYFGNNTEKVVLVVEKKKRTKEEHGTILESSLVNDIVGQIANGFTTETDPICCDSLQKHLETLNFYRSIYTFKNVNDMSYLKAVCLQPFDEEAPELHNKDDDRQITQIYHDSNDLSASCPSLISSVDLKVAPHPQYSKINNIKCVGIPNIGNSCYMNSSLQCINNCILFSDFFAIYENNLNLDNDNSIIYELYKNKEYKLNKKIISTFSDFIVRLKTDTDISASALKNAIGHKNFSFNNCREQDAAEFIMALLTYLHEGLCYNINDTRKLSSEEKIELKKDHPFHGLTQKKKTQEEKSIRVGPDNINDLAEHDAEFRRLIRRELSIVSELFYGMFTTILECQSCNFRKTKNDLMMFLPLPIPNRINYHCSSILITSNCSVPKKILVPLNYTMQEAIAYTKTKYVVVNSIIPVEYGDSYPVSIIASTKNISDVKNKIVFYEYNPHIKYAMCHLFYTKYLFMKRKIQTDFLLEVNNFNHQLYGRLRPFFVKDLSYSQFIKGLDIKKTTNNNVLNIPTFDVVIKDIYLFFGNNLNVLSPCYSAKNDDISLTDCLNYYFKEETVDLRCDGCNKNTKYTMKTRLSKPPKYLIVHLKRFSYVGSNTKINTFIDFPEDCLKIGNKNYKLMSTANHIEIGMGYGHYVAYVKKGELWYCCNDSVISKTAGPDKSTAYILFYERID